MKSQYRLVQKNRRNCHISSSWREGWILRGVVSRHRALLSNRESHKCVLRSLDLTDRSGRGINLWHALWPSSLCSACLLLKRLHAAVRRLIGSAISYSTVIWQRSVFTIVARWKKGQPPLILWNRLE